MLHTLLDIGAGILLVLLVLTPFVLGWMLYARRHAPLDPTETCAAAQEATTA
jgi:hypothetical protein